MLFCLSTLGVREICLSFTRPCALNYCSLFVCLFVCFSLLLLFTLVASMIYVCRVLDAEVSAVEEYAAKQHRIAQASVDPGVCVQATVNVIS